MFGVGMLHIFQMNLFLFFSAECEDIRSPKGEIFSISRCAKFQGGRLRSNNKVIFGFRVLFLLWSCQYFVNILTQVFPSMGCGINIANITLDDAGQWRYIIITNIHGIIYIFNKCSINVSFNSLMVNNFSVAP